MIFGEYNSPGLETFALFVRRRSKESNFSLRFIVLPEDWYVPLEDELNRINDDRIRRGKPGCFWFNRESWFDGYDNFMLKGVPICLGNDYEEHY